LAGLTQAKLAHNNQGKGQKMDMRCFGYDKIFVHLYKADKIRMD
jgi:hypothetical protein